MPKISDTLLLQRAHQTHNGKFTYGPFVKSSTGRGQLFTVICPAHGEFTQAVSAHLGGKGCKKCAMASLLESQKHTLESVKKKTAGYGFDYEYLSIDYGTLKQPHIVYLCKEHGKVSQNLYNHLQGKGCVGCRGLKARHNLASATEAARSVHGNTYTYLELTYEPCTVKGRPFEGFLVINCAKHGSFRQKLNTHLMGSGCPTCGYESLSDTHTKTDEEILKDCDVDSYKPLSVIRGEFTSYKVEALCAKHGSFVQYGYNRMKGQACPSCSGLVAKACTEMRDWLLSCGIPSELEQPLAGTKLTLDLTVPSLRIAIEHNGIYWHSDEYKDRHYHINKQRLAESQGWKLINVFDDEWIDKQALVKRSILHALGHSTGTKIAARKCKVVQIAPATARQFMSTNHIQGFAHATVHLGLEHDGVLLAVVSLTMKERGRAGKHSSKNCELIRYSTACTVQGGFTKLLEAARRLLGFSVITTFSDDRFFGGNLYAVAGFTAIAKLPPDYFYCKSGKRQHKSSLQKGRIAKASSKGSAIFVEGATEKVLAELNGYSRVWDSGKTVWQRTWA